MRKPKTSPLKKLHWRLLFHLPIRYSTVRTRNGLITYETRDRAVGKHVFFRREYDVDKVRDYVETLVSRGLIDAEDPGTALNVGANIGLISNAIHMYTPLKEVVAFEPVPSNYRLLKKNISQNGFEGSIKAVNLALSAEDACADMELSGSNFGDHRIRITQDIGVFHEESWNTISVGVNRLDTIAESELLRDRKIGLIWMDIQGHDGHFFLGAHNTIRKGRIPTINEFWPYGILRSGMSRKKYCEVAGQLFTHYLNPDDGMVPVDIATLDPLFDRYADPEKASDLLFVNLCPPQ